MDGNGRVTLPHHNGHTLECTGVARRSGLPILRAVLTQRRARRARFQLRDASFKGNGLQPGVQLADWSDVAAQIYGGRGG